MALDCQERAVAVGWRKIRRELRTARGAGPGFLGSSVLRLCTPPPRVRSGAGEGGVQSGPRLFSLGLEEPRGGGPPTPLLAGSSISRTFFLRREVERA